jgi:hypothetical protein
MEIWRHIKNELHFHSKLVEYEAGTQYKRMTFNLTKTPNYIYTYERITSI